jgi:type IV pilus assembly protein PilY1
VKEIAMSSTRSFAPRLAAFALAAALMLPAAAGRADDTELFSAAVPPNVLLVIDNSGSMNQVVWHPAFDPAGDPTCNYWNETEYYLSQTGHSDTTASSTDTNGFRAQSYTISSSGCVSTSRNIFADTGVDAENNYTRWDGKYLNWYFSDAATPYISEITSTTNGTFSSCLGGGTYTLYRRARVTAAKNILRDVICQVNAQGAVRFGLAQFRRSQDQPDSSRDVNGGYVLVPINDYNTTAGTPNVYTLNGTSQSHGDHLDDAIESLEGETNTPLAETLFQVYTYFHSRTVGNIPTGKDDVAQFPLYTYRPRESSGLGGDHSTAGVPTVPDSPVQYACQKNFVIIITDGEPTRDDFDISTPTSTAQGFANFTTLIGDYNLDGEVEIQPPDPVICSSTTTDCEIALYLDDIAKFMHEKDFRPDLDDEQTLDVYTVGFTTSAFANALLAKTAAVSNGQFFFSNNAEQLAADIIAAISDIEEKAQSFTAATVPASRTADGEQLYVSLFTPSNGNPYWDGHLRSYRLTGAGDIQDANGDCAIDDPTGGCFSGPFLPVADAPPFWDASDEMPAPAARELRASVLRGVGLDPEMAEFVHQALPTTTGISTLDLGVTFPPASIPLGSIATTADQYAAEIVANIRGCEFGTGANSVACVLRDGQLADIFHSNPVVVGQPVLFESDPSYKLGFKGLVADRQRLIYAGSNGGFLHGFDAGTWQPSATPPQYDVGTGAEVFGFMPWPARQNIRFKPFDTGARDYYFVDGSPSVADAWLYTSHTVGTKQADGSEWRTVLVGSMRQGGEAYYALDVTNPAATLCDAPATGDGYPCYLWEFPREDDGAAYQNWVAQTWGDAILTKIRVQVGATVLERWVAVVTGGYHPTSDPNEVAYDPDATEGRSIWVLDIKTGVPLAWHKFDTAGDCANPSSVVNNTADRQMCFSLASTPAVYDADGDSFADVIYAPDVGGNVWKWVIKAPLNLADATTASQPATDWPFRKFFAAEPYDDGSDLFYKSFYFPPAGTRKNGKIWLAFGSGERNNLLYLGDDATADDNNRFYVVEEVDLFDQAALPAAVVTDADLTPNPDDNVCADLGGSRGYYIVGQEGEKWVTNVELFVGYVIANSYVPPASGSTDPCEIAGTAYLWAFRVECGQGLFTDAGGSSFRALNIGGGLPTDPRVTVGAAGDISNRVIISKQGGDIVNIEAPPGFPQSGSFYWRELPQ